MAIKNFWSLNVDEALVADKLQGELKKFSYEVFFPLRTQLKDIDLLLYNLKSKDVYAIQIKGSRSYKPQKREIERFGEGQAGWIQIKRDAIFSPTHKIDFFILLIHLEIQGEIKREIELNYIILPVKDFKKLLVESGKAVRKNSIYDFFIWINPKTKNAHDFNEWHNVIDLSKYLNNFKLLSSHT